MKKKNSRLKLGLFTASVFAALTFTISCSDGDGDTDTPVVVTVTVDVSKTIRVGEQTWLEEDLNSSALFEWTTAMALPPSCKSKSCIDQIQPKHKGICPVGWHIPSLDEWEDAYANITSETGFCISESSDIFWGADEFNKADAYMIHVNCSGSGGGYSNAPKTLELKVRCIKD